MVFDWIRGRRRAEPEPPLVDDGSLTVVASCFDPARADSAVVAELGASGVDVEAGPFLMRHVVTLPDAEAVAEAARVLGPDGWSVTVVGAEHEHSRVHISRQQRITGLEP